MTTLKTTLESLSADFAAHVLRAIRSASLDDIVGGSSARPVVAATTALPARRPGRPAKVPTVAAVAAGVAALPFGASAVSSKGARKGTARRRLPRRSQADILGVVDQIVTLLQRTPEGLRSEDIRAQLGLAANEMPRPIAEGLKAKRLSKEGEKRATVYFAKGASKKK
jgi:hypothetical protein